MKLSIITPYYKTLEHTKELAKVLVPQLTNEVEWIIIDDGCNELKLDNLGAKVIHLEYNTGNASVPRNIGIDESKGEYIAFIDSDDLVYDDYIKTILDKLDEDFDYCFYGWESVKDKVLIEDNPPGWNHCVWNCIYKRSLIGNNRFDPSINFGEDMHFNKIVRKGKKANIKKIIYYYRNFREGGLTERYHHGKLNERK